MLNITRKLIALMMALWLPLFSGSALAASVAMHAMGGDCSSAVEQPFDHHHAISHGQPTDHATHDGSGPHQGDHHDTSCKNCGVCHIACCGYIATIGTGVEVLQPSAKSYVSALSQFQSVTFAPLDPPPLVRA